MDCQLNFFKGQLASLPGLPSDTESSHHSPRVSWSTGTREGPFEPPRKIYHQPAEVMMKTTHTGESLKPQEKALLEKEKAAVV